MVTVLRFANVLGTDIVTPISTNLSRPLCPSIFGYDPLLQFVEEDDVVRGLEHVTRERIPGVFNVAGAGRLPWSEVAAHLRHPAAAAPARATPAAASPRWSGWGSSSSRPSSETSCATAGASTPPGSPRPGSTYRYTSAGAVENFIRAVRLRRECRASHRPRTPTSTTSSSSSATPRRCVRTSDG